MWSRFFKATLYSLLLIGAIGCVPTKRLTYLQEEEGSSKEYKLERNAYRVQPNDILSITIRTYDAETSQLFNIANMSQPNALQAGDILFYLQGYSIDLNGEISIPIIGKLQVLDLSIEEIQNLVENYIGSFLVILQLN